METATELVVHAAPLHSKQCLDDHVERFLLACSLPVAQQEIMNRRPGKFRRSAEAAAFRIEDPTELRECRVRNRRIDATRARCGFRCGSPQLIQNLVARFYDA